MEKEIEIEFSKLKLAYVAVKGFLEEEAFGKIQSISQKIDEDLGLSGDDNYDMLVKFVHKFELDYSDFKYEDHFYSESELFGSEAAFCNFLTLSIWVPLKTIELITLNKLQFKKLSFFTPNRTVKDLTFREMVNWYVQGKFSIDSIKYKITTNT